MARTGNLASRIFMGTEYLCTDGYICTEVHCAILAFESQQLEQLYGLIHKLLVYLTISLHERTIGY